MVARSHPAPASDDGDDRLFRALADPSRRELLDRLNRDGGRTLSELSAGLDMTRQAVSKHLGVLEAANLVTSVRRGREKLHYLNAAPVADLSGRWINRYHTTRVRALADLKHALEAPMDRPEFVYTTYIHTTPEALWQALTEPAFTSRYWGCTFDCDWKEGSTYSLEQNGVRTEDPDQRILVSDPPRRLAYTWHTFSPEWAEAVGRQVGFSDEYMARLAAEPRSKVSFEIEPVGPAGEPGGLVKLTVVHDGFPAGSEVHQGISQGWPMILSQLKTLLEKETAPVS